MGSHETALTIGIDARAATEEVAGRGRVVRELLRAFAARDEPHRYRLYAREPWEEEHLDARFAWRLDRRGDVTWHPWAARRIARECDVCLATNSYLTAILTRVPTATMVYDLAALDPATRPALRSAVVERVALRASVARSDALLAISRATADALAERLPASAAKTTIMPLGVSPSLERMSSDDEATLPSDFVLAVGTLEPRKNFPRLVDAYRRLPAEIQDAHPLVVVGRAGWKAGPTLDALRSLGDRCQMLGAVPDAVLAGLYRRCAVFCYPSLAEGFGLPVLEAMAAGAAVLTSNRSSLPEVGGDAVAYADPTDVEDLSSHLARLLRDPAQRAELGARARARAAEFSWQVAADSALAALERIATQPQSARARP
jgi:glycosyltransferase involved in cell wall biosynthesis